MGAAGADSAGDVSWSGSLAAARAEFEPTDTRADDPALLIYTSGTTGPAKGAVIPHRALIRQPERLRREPGLVRGRRPVLEPGRLGVDGRAVGRAAARRCTSAAPSSRRAPASTPTSRSS